MTVDERYQYDRAQHELRMRAMDPTARVLLFIDDRIASLRHDAYVDNAARDRALFELAELARHIEHYARPA